MHPITKSMTSDERVPESDQIMYYKPKALHAYFLGIRLLTQSVAPTTKEEPVSQAVIGPPCVLQADGY